MTYSIRTRQSGHSLVEVSITLLLILIVATFVIPNSATAVANIYVLLEQNQRNRPVDGLGGAQHGSLCGDSTGFDSQRHSADVAI